MKIVTLTGPSGVGKTTLSRLLAERAPDRFACAVLTTTRAPKDGDGGEYRYVSREDYDALERDGRLLASTEIPSVGEERRYGYDAHDLEAQWAKGLLPVVIAEPDLLAQFVAALGRKPVISIGLVPPGRTVPEQLLELALRLGDRGRETPEQLERRLLNATNDLAFYHDHPELFDALIVNDDQDDAVEAILRVLSGS